MSKAKITYDAVVSYFRNNKKAIAIARNKPRELFEQECADTIIEIIESEIDNDAD